MLQCIRMALSGVARTQGRVGKGLVAKMLCGSHSQPVRQLRLDQLSTFGLLAHLRQSEATSLLNALIKADLVEQTENQRNRPIVKLTSRGEQVMKGHLRLDPQVPLGAPLRTKLRNIPLAQTAARAARTLGAGAVDSAAPKQLTPSPPPADQPTRERVHRSPTNQPDYYWTWRVVECRIHSRRVAQIRRLDQAEVFRHLRQAAGAGMEVRATDVFTPHEMSQLLLLAAAGDHAAHGRVEPHATDVTADQLALFQSCQDREPNRFRIRWLRRTSVPDVSRRGGCIAISPLVGYNWRLAVEDHPRACLTRCQKMDLRLGRHGGASVSQRPLNRPIDATPDVLRGGFGPLTEQSLRKTLMENSSRDKRAPTGDSKTAIRRPGPNIWVLLVIFGVMAIALLVVPGQRQSTIPYSFFLEQVQQGNVDYVQLGDQEATGPFREPPPGAGPFRSQRQAGQRRSEEETQQAFSRRVTA